MVSHFVEEACDLRTLAAMCAGSVFYRLGRVGTLALAARAPQAAPFLSLASYGIGLASEVTVFQGVSEVLTNSLQRESGEFWNHWRTSFLQFGLLKLGGAATVGQNPFVQHLFQDTAMVTGHQVTARLGFTPAPEGSFADQFLHAEITNLQIGAGMGLMHSFSPRFSALERSLDLSLRSPSPVFSIPESFGPRFAFAEAREGGVAPSRDPLRETTVWMSSIGNDGKDPPEPKGRGRRFLEWIGLGSSGAKGETPQVEESEDPYRGFVRTRTDVDVKTERLLRDAEPAIQEALRAMEREGGVLPGALQRFQMIPALESAVIASQNPKLPLYFSGSEMTKWYGKFRSLQRDWLWSPNPIAHSRALALVLTSGVRGAADVSEIDRRLRVQYASLDTLVLRNLADRLTEGFDQAAQKEGLSLFPTQPRNALQHPIYLSSEIRDLRHDFFRSPLLETALLQNLRAESWKDHEDEFRLGNEEFFSERSSSGREATFGFRRAGKNSSSPLLLAGLRGLEWFFEHPDQKVKAYAWETYLKLSDRLIAQGLPLQEERFENQSRHFPDP